MKVNIMEDIKKLGLSENEAKIYIALLNFSKGTVLTLSKASGVARPATYQVLDSLQKKGLCSLTKIGKKTFYVIENPERLNNLILEERIKLEEKSNGLKDLLKQLNTIYEFQYQDKPFVRFFEGKKGLSTTKDELNSKKNQTVYSIFSVDGYKNASPDAEREAKHKERIAKNITADIIYTSKFTDISPDETRKCTKIDSKDFPLSADIMIADGKVRINTLNDSFKGIIIENKDIFETFVSIYKLAKLGAAASPKKSLSLNDKDKIKGYV